MIWSMKMMKMNRHLDFFMYSPYWKTKWKRNVNTLKTLTLVSGKMAHDFESVKLYSMWMTHWTYPHHFRSVENVAIWTGCIFVELVFRSHIHGIVCFPSEIVKFWNICIQETNFVQDRSPDHHSIHWIWIRNWKYHELE